MFDELGMSFTTAVNVFVKQALREGALPFEVTLHPRGRTAYDYATEDLPAK